MEEWRAQTTLPVFGPINPTLQDVKTLAIVFLCVKSGSNSREIARRLLLEIQTRTLPQTHKSAYRKVMRG